jgi:hypothetical protein
MERSRSPLKAVCDAGPIIHLNEGGVLYLIEDFLSCLRIKHPVTRIPARLNSRPVANGYPGRPPTYKTTRPCQAASFLGRTPIVA